MTREDDERMWRRLLAELHPDQGGSTELFAFASNLRDEYMARESPAKHEVDAAFTGNLPMDLLVLYLRMWSR